MKAEQDQYETVITYIIENQDKFYRLAYSYVHKKEDALDIVQNTICKALENYETLRKTEAIRSWFYRILVNESLAFLNRSKKELLSDLWENQEGEENCYIEGESVPEDDWYERGETLYDEINALPYELQNIIKLHFFEKMKLREIAEIMNMNLSTVKAKLYRGLKKMKKNMEG